MSYKAVSSRDHLKLIKRHFGIGTWTYDIAADRFEWSYGLRRVLRVEGSTGSAVAEFLDMAHPDDRQVLEDKIRTGLDIDAAPLRMTAADGAQLWLQFHVEVVSEDDKPLVVFGAAQDITVVKNAQLAYLQRRRLSMSLVSLLEAIVWYVSPSGVLDFEVGWCSFTGTTPSENNGGGWLKAIHPDDREHSKAAWETSFRTKSTFLTTHRVRRSDGTYHTFQATGAPVLNDQGEVIEFIGFARRVFDEEKLRPSSMDVAPKPWTAEDYRCARAVLGWSLERLATESGVSASTIKRMEVRRTSEGRHPSGQSRPPSRRLRRRRDRPQLGRRRPRHPSPPPHRLLSTYRLRFGGLDIGLSLWGRPLSLALALGRARFLAASDLIG